MKQKWQKKKEEEENEDKEEILTIKIIHKSSTQTDTAAGIHTTQGEPDTTCPPSVHLAQTFVTTEKKGNIRKKENMNNLLQSGLRYHPLAKLTSR